LDRPRNQPGIDLESYGREPLDAVIGEAGAYAVPGWFDIPEQEAVDIQGRSVDRAEPRLFPGDVELSDRAQQADRPLVRIGAQRPLARDRLQRSRLPRRRNLDSRGRESIDGKEEAGEESRFA
jgi:hypothetical protein